MDTNPHLDPTSPPIGPVRRTEALYQSPADGARAVVAAYQYWTGKLTDTSLQMSYAVIAANWAAFGSVNRILANSWSKLSLSLVLLSLGISVIGAKVMGELHRKHVDYSETDASRWAQEFEDSKGKRHCWPFTKTIERLGRFMRETKMWLPILAGVAFILALRSH